MKRFLLVICAVFLLPSLANAANAFVWNFDPQDRFYDAEVGDSIDCSYWLERTLSDNGHSVQADSNLPGDLSPYDVVFVTTGWFRC
jgi:hypothetical protein